jgi:hypothetical protein
MSYQITIQATVKFYLVVNSDTIENAAVHFADANLDEEVRMFYDKEFRSKLNEIMGTLEDAEVISVLKLEDKADGNSES